MDDAIGAMGLQLARCCNREIGGAVVTCSARYRRLDIGIGS